MNNDQLNTQTNLDNPNLVVPPVIPPQPEHAVDQKTPVMTGPSQSLQISTSPQDQTQNQGVITITQPKLEQPNKKSRKKRRIVLFALPLLMIVLLGGAGLYKWTLMQKAYGEPFETYSVNQNECDYNLKVPKGMEKHEVDKPYIIGFTNSTTLPRDQKFSFVVKCDPSHTKADNQEAERQMKEGRGLVYDTITKDLPEVDLGKFTETKLANGETALIAEGIVLDDKTTKNYFLFKFNEKQTYIIIAFQGAENYKEFPATWKKMIAGMELNLD